MLKQPKPIMKNLFTQLAHLAQTAKIDPVSFLEIEKEETVQPPVFSASTHGFGVDV